MKRKRLKTLLIAFLMCVTYIMQAFLGISDFTASAAEKELPEPYKYWGIAISAVVDVTNGGGLQRIVEGRSLKVPGNPYSSIYGKDINATLTTDVSVPKEYVVENSEDSILAFDDYRLGPYPNTENKNLSWKEDETLIWMTHRDAVQNKSAGLPFTFNRKIDSKNFDITIHMPDKATLLQAPFQDRNGTTDGSDRKYDTTMSFVLVAHHEDFNPETGEWDIESKVSADLKMKEDTPATWNYKDFDENIETEYGVNMDASGSSSARPGASYTYDMGVNVKGNVDYRNEKTFTKNNINLYGDIYPDEIDGTVKSSGTFRVDGFVEVEDDKGVSANKYAYTTVNYNITNEKPTAILKATDKGTSSNKYLYAKRSIIIKDMSLDPESHLMDSSFTLYDGAKQIAIWKFKRDTKDGAWTVVSSDKSDEYIEDMSLNASSLENTLTFKKSGNFKMQQTVGDIRNHEIVTQKFDTRNSTLNIRTEAAAPKADFEYILNGKVTDYTYPGVEVALLDKSTDANDDIIKWEWTKHDNSNQEGQTGVTAVFSSEGTYNTTLKITDFLGLTDSITKPIQVLPPIPKAEIATNKDESLMKKNRRIIISSEESFAPPSDPIQWDKTKWKIEPLEGQKQESIKISNDLSNSKQKAVVFKESGKYKATIDLENNYTQTNPNHPRISLKTTSIIIEIKDDIKPEPKFTITGNAPNFKDNPVSTVAKVANTSNSPDNDYLDVFPDLGLEDANNFFGRGQNTFEMEIRKDINEDGIFGNDEIYGNYTEKSVDIPVTFRENEGSNYQASLKIKETFGQPTIKEFVTDEDRVTNTLVKKFLINWVPDIIFDITDWAYPDDTLSIATKIKDERVNTTTVEWTVDKKNTDGTYSNILLNTATENNLTKNGGNIRFRESGYYKLTAEVTDEKGQKSSHTEEIRIYPFPTAVISDNAAYRFDNTDNPMQFNAKQNRKYELLGNTSYINDPYGTGIHNIDHSKDYFEIVPLDGQPVETIKVTDGIGGLFTLGSEDAAIFKATNKNLDRELLFKLPGTYKVRYQVTNIHGKKSTFTEQIITVHEDKPPTALYELEDTIYRDPNNGNKARITAYNIKIASLDRDAVSAEGVRYRFDSNNNGSFDDEAWKGAPAIDKTDPYNWKVEMLETHVGKYQLEVYSEETFGQPTIQRYITDQDKRKGSSIKICNVDNKAPIADFSLIAKDKVDIVYVVGNTEFGDLPGLGNKIDSVIRAQVGSHFGSSVDVSVLKKISYINTNTLDAGIKDVNWRENSTRIVVAFDDTGSLIGYDASGNLNQSAYLNILRILELKNIHIVAFGDPQRVKSKFEKIIADNNGMGMYTPFTCKQVWDYSSNSSFTVPTYGEYKIEAWGKQGKSFYVPPLWWIPHARYEIINKYGGNGSYASGNKVFAKGEVIYPRFDLSADVRTNPNDLNSRIVVAGGGGDAAGIDECLYYFEGKIMPRANGFPGDVGEPRPWGSSYGATPGTENNGGEGGWLKDTSSRYSVILGLKGKFGEGAEPPSYSKDMGGGGGDGWYGGGSGYKVNQLFIGYDFPERQPDGTVRWVEINRGGDYHYQEGGAGGSSHVDFSLYNRIIKKGNEATTQPSGIDEVGHSGNGYVRITKILGADDTDSILKGFVNYIIQKTVRNTVSSDKSIMYILLNQYTNYKINYVDYENDPQMNIHSWKFDQDPYYFENNLGRIPQHNQWISSGINPLDKTGKYLVEYKTKDNPVGTDDRFDSYRKCSTMVNGPMSLFVHRKPIAQVRTKVYKNAGNITANLTSAGYDIDHQSSITKGIRAWEWSYKEIGSSTWISGGTGTTFTLNGQTTKDYLVKHRVQDIDGISGIGVWSDDNIILITAKPMPPVADFEVSPTIYPLRSNLAVMDYSYDPNGDNIVEYRWTLSKNGVVHHTQTLTNGFGVNQAQVDSVAAAVKNKIDSFGHAAYGDWKLELQVRDNTGAWGDPLATSDIVSRIITVVPNNAPPVVNINPNHVFVDGRNSIDTDNLSNPLNNFINWNLSVSDLDTDNKGFVYKWELEHHQGENGLLKNSSEISSKDQVTKKIYTTQVPFTNQTFENNNLLPGPYKARLQVTDIPTFGEAKTTSVEKRFYVVPKVTGIPYVISEEGKEEIICGDTVTLRIITDEITTGITAEAEGKTIDLSFVKKQGSQYIWEAAFIVPEIEDSGNMDITFTLKTDFGSKDVFGTYGQTTRIKKLKETIYVTALKLEDFRVTDLVKHSQYKDLYPIRRPDFTLDYIAGYYCTFQINAKGNPERVFADVSHNTSELGTVELKKVGDSGTYGVWEGKYFAPFDTPRNTVISFDLEASKGSTKYNYNEKESWDGETLKITDSILKDAVIARTN